MVLRFLVVARKIIRLLRKHKVATKVDDIMAIIQKWYPGLRERVAWRIARAILRWAKRLGFGGAGVIDLSGSGAAEQKQMEIMLAKDLEKENLSEQDVQPIVKKSGSGSGSGRSNPNVNHPSRGVLYPRTDKSIKRIIESSNKSSKVKQKPIADNRREVPDVPQADEIPPASSSGTGRRRRKGPAILV